MQDITERKLAEEQLIKHRRHLEELVAERTESLNKEREGFISMLIHDLKGPLVPIIGFTNRLIKKKRTQEETEKSLNIIQESAQKLLETIERNSKDLRRKFALQSFNPKEVNLKDILVSVKTKNRVSYSLFFFSLTLAIGSSQ